ncbi:MAG: hypothetical protein ACAF41_33465 (plasmid) [Leptolyngbya sp. BL-A-14]
MSEPPHSHPETTDPTDLSFQQSFNQCLDRWPVEGEVNLVELTRLIMAQAQQLKVDSSEYQALSDRLADTPTKPQVQAVVKRVSEHTLDLERLSRLVAQQGKTLKVYQTSTTVLVFLLLVTELVLFLHWYPNR